MARNGSNLRFAPAPQHHEPTAVAAASSVAAGPTHASMAQRGWHAAHTMVDPHTGRRGTVYVNPRSLPKPQKDWRPLAEDINKPNPRLVQLQGNHHSSDPIITRDMVEGREGLTHGRDGTNFDHVLQEHVRADHHDRALRSIAMTQGGLPEKERQTGSKAGFWGLHNIMRIVPYLPPQLRDLLQQEAPYARPATETTGIRATISTHRPTHRPGMQHIKAQPGLEHAGAAPRGIQGEPTRAAPLRHTHGRRDEIVTQMVYGSGAESRVKTATHVPRRPEQVRRDQDMNNNPGTIHSNERLPQASMLPLPMRFETEHTTNRRINAGTHDIRGITAVPTRNHGHEHSISATARGIVQRLVSVMPGAQPATEWGRALPMRYGQARDGGAQHRHNIESVKGTTGEHTRIHMRPRDTSKLEPAQIRGIDGGESGATYLERAQRAHMDESDIAAAAPVVADAHANSHWMPLPTIAA